MTYYTINAAMLYDCLYHLPSNEFQNHDLDAIKSQLKEILSRSITLTVDTIASYETLSTNQKYWGEGIPEDYEYPALPIVQYRFQVLGATGLAALLGLPISRMAEADQAAYMKRPAVFVARESCHPSCQPKLDKTPAEMRMFRILKRQIIRNTNHESMEES